MQLTLIILSLLSVVTASLFLLELGEWPRRLARWLCTTAIKRLPPEHRATYAEVFLGELYALPGNSSKLFFGIAVFTRSRSLAKYLRSASSSEPRQGWEEFRKRKFAASVTLSALAAILTIAGVTASIGLIDTNRDYLWISFTVSVLTGGAFGYFTARSQPRSKTSKDTDIESNEDPKENGQ